MVSFYSHCSKAALIMSAGLLVACGDGSSSSAPVAMVPPPPPPDTSAPTVTLEASKTTVEGGETIVLTAMANDNVDTQVTPTLTCDGGTLVSDFLRTDETDINVTVACSAQATDDAGNTGSANLDINVQTTNISLLEDSRVVKPGEFGLVELIALQASDQSFAARLDNQEISVIRQGSALLFMTPLDSETGVKTLEIEVNDKIYSFDVEVEAADEIENPEQFLRNNFQGTIDLIDAFLDENSNDLTSQQVSQINAHKGELQEVVSTLSSQPTEDLQQAALLLSSNNLFDVENNPVFQKLTFEQIQQCIGSGLKFTASMIGTATTIGIIAATETNIITAAIGLKLTYELIDFLKTSPNSPIALARQTWDICVNGNVQMIELEIDELLANSVFKTDNSIRKEGRTIFFEGRPVKFATKGVQDVADEADGFFPDIQELIGHLKEVEAIPSSFINSLESLFDIPSVDIPANALRIDNISREDVSVVINGESLVATYTGTAEVTSNIDFSFDVIFDEEDVQSTVQAQLTVFPEADDIMVEAIAGQSVNIDFQTRGADSVRQLSQPSKGIVTLHDDLSFTYAAYVDSEGEDKFSFEAVNARGVSDPATVFVEIEAGIERFIGTYNVESTHSEFPGEVFDVELFVDNALRLTGVFVDLQTPSEVTSSGGLTFSDTIDFSNSDGTITENSTIEFTLSQNLELTGTVVREFNRGTSIASTTTETYSGSKVSE